jgi:hypothetical protein
MHVNQVTVFYAGMKDMRDEVETTGLKRSENRTISEKVLLWGFEPQSRA